jgi:predicted transcriptional regulator
MSAQLLVTEGDMADGKMVLTGTDMKHGHMMHTRNTTFNMTDKGFEWTMESSMDGENYATMMKATYTKR